MRLVGCSASWGHSWTQVPFFHVIAMHSLKLRLHLHGSSVMLFIGKGIEALQSQWLGNGAEVPHVIAIHMPLV